MPHRPDTWTDALFIYPLYHVNFLTSFMEWFRFFFNGVTVKTENKHEINLFVRCVEFSAFKLFVIASGPQ